MIRFPLQKKRTSARQVPDLSRYQQFYKEDESQGYATSNRLSADAASIASLRPPGIIGADVMSGRAHSFTSDRSSYLGSIRPRTYSMTSDRRANSMRSADLRVGSGKSAIAGGGQANSITVKTTEVKDFQGRTKSVTKQTVRRLNGMEVVETTTTTTTIADGEFDKDFEDFAGDFTNKKHSGPGKSLHHNTYLKSGLSPDIEGIVEEEDVTSGEDADTKESIFSITRDIGGRQQQQVRQPVDTRKKPKSRDSVRFAAPIKGINVKPIIKRPAAQDGISAPKKQHRIHFQDVTPPPSPEKMTTKTKTMATKKKMTEQEMYMHALDAARKKVYGDIDGKAAEMSKSMKKSTMSQRMTLRDDVVSPSKQSPTTPVALESTKKTKDQERWEKREAERRRKEMEWQKREEEKKQMKEMEKERKERLQQNKRLRTSSKRQGISNKKFFSFIEFPKKTPAKKESSSTSSKPLAQEVQRKYTSRSEEHVPKLDVVSSDNSSFSSDIGDGLQLGNMENEMYAKAVQVAMKKYQMTSDERLKSSSILEQPKQILTPVTSSNLSHQGPEEKYYQPIKGSTNEGLLEQPPSIVFPNDNAISEVISEPSLSRKASFIEKLLKFSTEKYGYQPRRSFSSANRQQIFTDLDDEIPPLPDIPLVDPSMGDGGSQQVLVDNVSDNEVPLVQDPAPQPVVKSVEEPVEKLLAESVEKLTIIDPPPPIRASPHAGSPRASPVAYPAADPCLVRSSPIEPTPPVSGTPEATPPIMVPSPNAPPTRAPGYDEPMILNNTSSVSNLGEGKAVQPNLTESSPAPLQRHSEPPMAAATAPDEPPTQPARPLATPPPPHATQEQRTPAKHISPATPTKKKSFLARLFSRKHATDSHTSK
ncbi:Msc3p Ecym_4129 [Eremothecium cymbalariae DBVPG|uniref:Uncharacterized protein n=1 Tax=Eremothecium cymbalariae (strain CBS 270.75 / DBVPG 7215 / KCTC 17166 / NRRL Y-17582) TaxID=931890 RepID=G8JT55_ERECY|nr:hypothetical protein Ecym_4129 [Eremothecium cymbalariae DBVPG\